MPKTILIHVSLSTEGEQDRLISEILFQRHGQHQEGTATVILDVHSQHSALLQLRRL